MKNSKQLFRVIEENNYCWERLAIYCSSLSNAHRELEDFNQASIWERLEKKARERIIKLV